MSGHVFISYRHEAPDAAYVQALAEHLAAAGVSVWYDQQIISGDRWDDLIRQQVDTCAALIVVMTPQSEASPWVKREISQAEDAGRPILPLLLAGRRFFRLADLQYDDVTDGQLPPERFVARLRALAPAGATPAPPPPPPPDQPTLVGHTGPVGGVAWSADGRRIATGSNDGTVRVWDSSTREPLAVLTGHGAWVRSVSWSPDGARLVSCGDDNAVRFWDTGTGACVAAVGGTQGFYSVSWSANQRHLAAATFGGVQIVELGQPATPARPGHDGIVWCVAFSPDAYSFATAGADQTGRVWRNGNVQHVLTGHVGMVRSVGWSPDARRVVTAGDDGTLRFWDAGTGVPAGTIQAHYRTICTVAWSPDGARFATASDDRTVAIWNAATGACERQLTGHSDEVWSVAWSPDGRHLVSGSADHTARLWTL